MTLYISEFWCGVVATVVFEIVLTITLSVAFSIKGDEKKGKKADEADGAVGTYDGSGEWHEGSVE